MNAYELQALRHIFAMTIDECATWIAQTGDSESWRQWENGKCAIPDRVVEQLLAMRQQRKKHLHAIIGACLRFCVNAFLRSDRPGGHRTR